MKLEPDQSSALVFTSLQPINPTSGGFHARAIKSVSLCLSCLPLSGGLFRRKNCRDLPLHGLARAVIVTPKELSLVAQGAGRIEARYVSPVGFEVGGRLISRHVDIGDLVKKGQKLAELSAVDYQNKVTAAQADVAAAKAALAQAAAQENRKRILLEQGLRPSRHV